MKAFALVLLVIFTAFLIGLLSISRYYISPQERAMLLGIASLSAQLVSVIGVLVTSTWFFLCRDPRALIWALGCAVGGIVTTICIGITA